MRFCSLVLLLFATAFALAADYPAVVPGESLRFPQDDGSHPQFRIEWWYVTGWLDDEKGEPLGFQITFFRSRPGLDEDNPSAFAARQLLIAHAAISDPKHGRLRHDERRARAGFGLAEAKENRAEVWIDDWRLAQTDKGYVAAINARDFKLSLSLETTQSLLIQGENGVSRKGSDPAQASYYYSVPQLKVAGEIARNGNRERVTGIAWLDHEWSSTYLAEGAVGWDWTAINLDGGGAFMAFRIRDAKGEAVWAGGAYRESNGETRIFKRDEIRFSPMRDWRSPRSGATYPIAMRVRAADLEVTLTPLLDDQEFDARASTGNIYWEGAVRAMRDGANVGRGYLELTGYWRRLRM